MKKITNRSIAICFAVVTAASLSAAANPEGKSTSAVTPAGVAARTTDLQPFTRTAYILAGADLSSIKFESVTAIQVATAGVSFADERYCRAALQETGGSLYCPYVRDESPVPAYQVTYSFNGPPMASDEYSGTRFSFSVNMRPEDLSPSVREAISERKMSRTAASKFFALTTSRGSMERLAIDEANSAFCGGVYTDGAWTRTNASCQDKLTYKTVAVPSDYIAVKVEPASVR